MNDLTVSSGNVQSGKSELPPNKKEKANKTGKKVHAKVYHTKKKIEIKKTEKHNPSKTSKLVASKSKADSSASSFSTGNNNSLVNSNSGGSSKSNGKGEGNNSGGNGKEASTRSNYYYVAVDQMPEPEGGMESIYAKANYPVAAKANDVKGTVYVLAYIDEKGFVRKIFLLKGIGYGCDQSAERAVAETQFEPGRNNGTPVKVQMTIAVKFGKPQQN